MPFSLESNPQPSGTKSGSFDNSTTSAHVCNSDDINSLQNMLVGKLPELMREHKDRLHDLLLVKEVRSRQ